MADHPLETVTASVDQNSELSRDLWKTGNYNRLYFSYLEKEDTGKEWLQVFVYGTSCCCPFTLSEMHFELCLEMKLFDTHLETCPRHGPKALQGRSVMIALMKSEKRLISGLAKFVSRTLTLLQGRTFSLSHQGFFFLSFLLHSIYRLL